MLFSTRESRWDFVKVDVDEVDILLCTNAEDSYCEVSDVIPTHFGGFVLLTTLLHGSLHTLYGHVLPRICRH